MDKLSRRTMLFGTAAAAVAGPAAIAAAASSAPQFYTGGLASVGFAEFAPRLVDGAGAEAIIPLSELLRFRSGVPGEPLLHWTFDENGNAAKGLALYENGDAVEYTVDEADAG